MVVIESRQQLVRQQIRSLVESVATCRICGVLPGRRLKLLEQSARPIKAKVLLNMRELPKSLVVAAESLKSGGFQPSDGRCTCK
jgi:hypothetical protein